MSLDNLNLGRSLQLTCEYIQNQVLASILETDTEVAHIESKQSQARMIHAKSTIDETASTNVFNQLSELIFGNIDRSLRINRLAPSTHRVSNFDTSYLVVSRKERINNLYSFTNSAVASNSWFNDSARTVPIDCKIENDKISKYEDLEKAFAKEQKTN